MHTRVGAIFIPGSLRYMHSKPNHNGAIWAWDAIALNKIVDHVKVVGSSPWKGLQGMGEITYGAEDTTAHSATLSILGNTGFRLDGQTAKGMLSIRINGGHGKIREGDGHLYPLLPNTAKSGIVQFELPRLANFPLPGTALLDRGLVTVEGRSLHRITYETTTTNASEIVQKQNAVVTDFYFDPAAHLLIKSANSIRADGAGSTDFICVITYKGPNIRSMALRSANVFLPM